MGLAERYGSVMASRAVALLSIPLVYVLLPRYGLVGVAVAVGVVRLSSRAITLVDGMRRLDLGFPVAFAARVATAAAAMGAALLVALRLTPGGVPALDAVARARGLLPLLAAAGLGVIVYGSVLRRLGGLHEDERRRLLGLPLPLKPLLRHLL